MHRVANGLADAVGAGTRLPEESLLPLAATAAATTHGDQSSDLPRLRLVERLTRRLAHQVLAQPRHLLAERGHAREHVDLPAAHALEGRFLLLEARPEALCL
eukprot:4803854-Prymnesium_polylepis.1